MGEAYSYKLETLGRLPIFFEKNEGQYDDQVKFVARAEGSIIFFTQNAMVIGLKCIQPNEETTNTIEERGHIAQTGMPREKATCSYRYIRIQLKGASTEARVMEGEPLQGKHHYFKDSQKVTNVSLYQKISYQAIYPGIDWVHYAKGKELENDFIIQPGVDPAQIRLSIKGADKVEIDQAGHLVLSGEMGEYRLLMPKVSLELDGVKKEIKGEYIIHQDQTIGLKIAAYETKGILTIDPILEYSTYLGKMDNYGGCDIAVDQAGNVYIVGSTDSATFPTTEDAYNGSLNGGSIVFITKLNASGTELIYSTYLGGSGNNYGLGITVDNDQIAYVTGRSDSSHFPLVAPYSSIIDNSAFIVKLNAAGDALLYSTGLASNTWGYSIAIDPSGNMYIVGTVSSNQLQDVIANALYPAYQPQCVGSNNTFIVKFSSDGTKVIYCTYLGGSLSDDGVAIATDSVGNTYVTGNTWSADFPVKAALYPTRLGGYNAFVGKFNAEGGAIYVTYLGGSNYDDGLGIAADSEGNAYVTGGTESSDFPLSSEPYDGRFTGGRKAFISKISADGSSLLYSTYLGGNNGSSIGMDIVLDSAQNMYITGRTLADDFPLKEPCQADYAGEGDAFITIMSAAGDELIFSTYLGGRGQDDGNGIALDSHNNIYVTGRTDSSDFPIVQHSYEETPNGGGEGFVSKVSLFRTAKIDYSLPVEDVSIDQGVTRQEVILPTGDGYEIICGGRLLTVFTHFKRVCGQRELVVGVLVYEIVNGNLVSRGYRTASIMTPVPLDPDKPYEALKVGPFEFSLPDKETSLGDKREFKVRVIAHYGDALKGYNY